jgi:hypothetical protein
MDWFKRLFGQDWDGSDRRASLRAPCTFEMQVTGATCSFLARSKDIGPTGIRFEGRGAFPSSLKKGLEVQLKNLEVSMDCERDTVQGKIVWVKRRNAGQFECAATFLEPPEVLKKTWVRPVLARSIRTSPQQKRRYLRAKADWTVPANLGGQIFEVRLRDLSLHGARFESIRDLALHDQLTLRLKDMQLRSQVRRVQKVGGSYVVGVQFEPDAGQRKALIKLLKILSGQS